MDPPICSDTTEENRVPFRNGHLGVRKSEGFFSVRRRVEHSTIPSDDSYYEERSCQVPPKRHEPMDQHLPDRDAFLEDGDSGDLEFQSAITPSLQS